MNLIKVTNYVINQDANTIKVYMQVKTENLSLATKQNPAQLFKEIYLDSSETWTVQDTHVSGIGSNNLKSLVDPITTIVGEYTQYTMTIPFSGTLADSEHYNTDQFNVVDFLILSITIESSALTALAQGTSICTDYTSLCPIYDISKMRLAALSSINSVICDCNCEIPRCFIHEVLTIDAFELYIACGQLYKAVKIYNKFYHRHPNTKNKSSNKPCGCNGN